MLKWSHSESQRECYFCLIQQLDNIPLEGGEAEGAKIAEDEAFIDEIKNDIELEVDDVINKYIDENLNMKTKTM